MVPVPSGMSAKIKFTLALYLCYIGVGLTKVGNGYISPSFFVPNLHSKVHTAWEDTTKRVSVQALQTKSPTPELTKRQGTRLHRQTGCKVVTNLCLWEKVSTTGSGTAREIICDMLCFLPARSSRTLRNHLSQTCKRSQRSFSSWAHD